MRNNTRLKDWLPAQRVEFFLSIMDSDAQRRALCVDFLAEIVSCTQQGGPNRNHHTFPTASSPVGGTWYGIRRHQDLVVKRCLRDKKRSRLLIGTVSPERGIVQVSFCGEGDDKRRLVDLESFCASAVTSDKQDRSVYDFYVSSLRLLTSLCSGDNCEARALISGSSLVSYDGLLQGICNDRLPCDLRRAYALLIQNLYVSRPPADYISPHRSTLVSLTSHCIAVHW